MSLKSINLKCTGEGQGANLRELEAFADLTNELGRRSRPKEKFYQVIIHKSETDKVVLQVATIYGIVF